MKILKYIGLGLISVLIISAIVFYPKLKMLNHVNLLFHEDHIVENFRTFDKIWPVSHLKKSTNPHIYPQGSQIELPTNFSYDGKQLDTKSFLDSSNTTGLLVIQNDTILFEEYYLGNTDTTRNISWSMAKSFISALIGIAVQEGHIQNVMQNVDQYVPMLKGSAYDGVSIKDVLQMSTGVKFNEDYGDYHSDINRWGRGFALGKSQDKFATTLAREREPGTFNHYVSINTHVLGMVLTRATKRTVTDYMQEKLWEPAGMEHGAYWLLDGNKMEMVLGGLNVTLRDYAKIGSIFLHNGIWREQQIVPMEWVRASTNPDAPHLLPGKNPNSTREFGYGYQWWIPESGEGEFMAQGVYNQNIYINPTSKTVIVKLSANPRFNDKSFIPSRSEAALEFFRTIVSQFEISELMEENLVMEETESK